MRSLERGLCAARLVFAALLFCAAAGPAFALDIAGYVNRLVGKAAATGTTGFTRPLQVGSTILVGDRITTEADSRLRVLMTDGALLSLGSSSTLEVEAYNKDPSVGQATLNMLEGVFKAASGTIARLGPDRFTIKTPLAVIGVRGTEVWGELNDYRLQIAMLSGTGITVTTSYGGFDMNQAGTGVTIVTGEAPPEPHPWSADRLQKAADAVSFDD